MEKKLFELQNLSQSVTALENLTHQGLETAVCPNVSKPILHTFVVYSLVPRINLSHTQHGYIRPKSQNTDQGRVKKIKNKKNIESLNKNIFLSKNENS